MGAYNGRKRVEIEQRQKVDGTELAIQRRRTADPCPEAKVGAHEPRRSACRCSRPGSTSELRMGVGAPFKSHQKFGAQVLIHCHPFTGVLGRECATADEKTRVAL